MSRGTTGSRRRRVLLFGSVVVVACFAIAVLMLLAGGSRPDPRAEVASAATRTPPPIGSTSGKPVTVLVGPATLPALVRTDDPTLYARAVASALFTVDPAAVTRSEFLRFWQGELPSVVYSDAARNGLTLAVQNRDAMQNLTSSWIPPQSAWSSEAVEHTANRFAITSVAMPDYWVNAVAAGEFRDPGLHMERVTGVLAQSYGPAAHRYSSSRSVVIDLALLCGPTQPGGCRLVAPQRPPALGDQ